MLVVETIGRIRREHLVKGKSIKEIARELKISRNTVRKVLQSEETSFAYEREVQPRPKLGRWKAALDTMLSANAGKSSRERLTLTRPTMRFVPVKSREQQAILSMHRARDALVKQRTQLVNMMRGLLAEFGVSSAQHR